MRFTSTLLPVAAVALLTLSSCVVPTDRYGRPVSPIGIGIYPVLPVGYVGESYFYGGRYYYGGRYETGRYLYHGRYYGNRYYHNGHYFYGGWHEHHDGRSSSHGHRR